jgi:hypothetical protein
MELVTHLLIEAKDEERTYANFVTEGTFIYNSSPNVIVARAV